MLRRMLMVLSALATVLACGILGYMLIEGWPPFDALYMTVITVASVGFLEVHELSPHGRAFTIVLILCGSATLIYTFSTLTAFIVEGELTDVLRRRKMKKSIARLDGHFIVCGVSATGRYIIEELVKTGRSLVVIDHDPAKLATLATEILSIEGDATHEAVLKEAKIDCAAGLFTALHSDADNLLVVVTAKGLRPKLTVMAKAINEESERKLRQVGADRVVMPNFIGGMRMVSEMLRPAVVTFLDVMLRDPDATIRVEELHVGAASPLAGKTLETSGLLGLAQASVVAIASTDGRYQFNPAAQRPITPGETIILMGEVAEIRAFAVANP